MVKTGIIISQGLPGQQVRYPKFKIPIWCINMSQATTNCAGRRLPCATTVLVGQMDLADSDDRVNSPQTMSWYIITRITNSQKLKDDIHATSV